MTYFKDRWSLFVALAPPLTMKGMANSPIMAFLTDERTTDIIKTSMKQLGLFEIYPANFINSNLFKTVCLVAHDICKFGDSLMADQNPDLNDEVAAKVYFGHYPSGSSLKDLDHFA